MAPRTSPMGTPTSSRAEEGLVGIFGERGCSADGPRQASRLGSPETYDVVDGRHPVPKFDTRRREHERTAVQGGEHHDLSSQPAAGDLGPLHRVAGLEDERTRHRRQREIEGNVHEDHQ